MEDAVYQRVIQIIETKCNGNVSEFARKVGKNQTTINNYVKELRPFPLEVIIRLLEVYPDVSAEWLLRGSTDMVSSTSLSSNSTNMVTASEFNALKAENQSLKDRVDELKRDKEFLMVMLGKK